MIKKITKRILPVVLALLMLCTTCIPAMAASTDTYDAEVTFEDEAVRGSIAVTKYKDDKKSVLSGVTYQLSLADGTYVKELTTGKDGKVTFEDLMPGTYVLTETKTAEGYTLLKDAVTIDLPYAVAKAQAEKDKLNVKKAALYNGTYYFYNLQYEITDTATFVLPMTGFFDSWTNWAMLIGAIGLVFAGGYVLLCKRSNKVSQQKGNS